MSEPVLEIEYDEGIVVEFDTPGGIFIPHGAIKDAGCCEQFRFRVFSHVTSTDLVAAGR